MSLKSLFLRLVRVHEKERERERQRDREREEERERERARPREREREGVLRRSGSAHGRFTARVCPCFYSPELASATGPLCRICYRRKERENGREGEIDVSGRERESERETFFICIHAMK